MINQKKIKKEKEWLIVKHLFVVYLFYFFLFQPFLGFFISEIGNPQVFQLVEEEDAGQSRFLEERDCQVISYDFLAHPFTLLYAKQQHLYFYYVSFYKEFKLETPNPPPEGHILFS